MPDRKIINDIILDGSVFLGKFLKHQIDAVSKLNSLTMLAKHESQRRWIALVSIPNYATQTEPIRWFLCS